MGARAASRRGFTLIELVVVLVVMAALAAIITPQLAGRLTDGEAGALSQNLTTLSTGMQRFRNDVGRYPDSIQHLVSLPGTARDVCGNLLPAAFRAEWSGPYLTRTVAVNGIVSGTSTILRDITRVPTTSSPSAPVGTLTLRADGVDRVTADAIEADFDGNANLDAGTIEWDVGSDPSRGTLLYNIPVRGC